MLLSLCEWRLIFGIFHLVDMYLLHGSYNYLMWGHYGVVVIYICVWIRSTYQKAGNIVNPALNQYESLHTFVLHLLWCDKVFTAFIVYCCLLIVVQLPL